MASSGSSNDLLLVLFGESRSVSGWTMETQCGMKRR